MLENETPLLVTLLSGNQPPALQHTAVFDDGVDVLKGVPKNDLSHTILADQRHEVRMILFFLLLLLQPIAVSTLYNNDDDGAVSVGSQPQTPQTISWEHFAVLAQKGMYSFSLLFMLKKLSLHLTRE